MHAGEQRSLRLGRSFGYLPLGCMQGLIPALPALHSFRRDPRMRGIRPLGVRRPGHVWPKKVTGSGHLARALASV
eukprot:6611042-Alexandrium_andersonii.AAC.1